MWTNRENPTRYPMGPISHKRVWISFILWISLGTVVPWISATASAGQKGTRAVLKKIYDEVKEMGPYPSQTFIQHEFFAGAPDDDDTNKDQHVVVLIQTVDGLEKMTIQVTYLERTKENRNVKYAREMKNISCLVAAGGVEIQSTDYTNREMDKLVPDILQAILNKKKLLKLK
jgi:hypothetical protein